MSSTTKEGRLTAHRIAAQRWLVQAIDEAERKNRKIGLAGIGLLADDAEGVLVNAGVSIDDTDDLIDELLATGCIKEDDYSGYVIAGCAPHPRARPRRRP